MEIKKNEIEALKAAKFNFIATAAIIAIVLLVIMGFLFDAIGSFMLAMLAIIYFIIRVKSDEKWDASKLKTILKEKVTTWKFAAAIAVSIGAIFLVWHFTDGSITVWAIASLFFIADAWFSSSIDGYLNDLNNTLKEDYEKPKSWLFESLFSIFIMPPMGIVATTYACLSILRYENNNFEGSYRASLLAYRWASIGVIVGMMCLLIIVRSLNIIVF